MKIAVLLASYNRKQKTLECLKSICAQKVPGGVHIEIYQTDDASTDGTAAAVKKHYPFVHLFNGNGSLFWAGGMRNTWKNALAHGADYYLLLNDDTVLLEDAVLNLLKSAKQTQGRAILVGSTIDLQTGKTSYGGSKLTSRKQWKSRLIEKPDALTQCDFGNANIMLVPRQIVEKIGVLSEEYTHGLADYDYTLTAKRAGFDVLVAPGYLGHCVDDHGHNWKSNQTSLRERIQYLMSPKGLAYKEYLNFIKKFFPLSYPSAFCKLWLKTFFPFIWDTFKK